MNEDKKVDDNVLNKVTGGLDNFFINLTESKKYDIKHDEKWRRMVKRAAREFDSQSVHFCVCGNCPGCGVMVGIAGDVCKDCRKEVKCVKE